MRLVLSLAIAASAVLCPRPSGWGSFTAAGEGTAGILTAVPRSIASHSSPVTHDQDRPLSTAKAAELSAADSAESRADFAATSYLAARTQHYFLGTLYELLLLLCLIAVRLGTRYRDWFARVVGRSWARASLYVPAVLGTVAILSFPVEAWNHALALNFHPARTSWVSWTTRWALSRAIDLAVVSIVVLLLYPIIRRGARTWWLVAWAVLLAVIGVTGLLRDRMFDLTRWLEPVTLRYPDVVADMERVARNAGKTIPPDHLVELIVPGSTPRGAFEPEFAGASEMWDPERIVFAEPLINDTDRPEILFAFGHEMGHLALHHSIKGLLIDAIILLALVYAAFRAGTWMLARWGRYWGIESMADHASLPLLLFLLVAINFVKVPAFNMTSRHFEREADRYGLEAIHGIVPSPGAAAAGLFQLCRERCFPDAELSGIPGFWFRDHPTDEERIRFAVTYDPWSHGRHPRYILPDTIDSDGNQTQNRTPSLR